MFGLGWKVVGYQALQGALSGRWAVGAVEERRGVRRWRLIDYAATKEDALRGAKVFAGAEEQDGGPVEIAAGGRAIGDA